MAITWQHQRHRLLPIKQFYGCHCTLKIKFKKEIYYETAANKYFSHRKKVNYYYKAFCSANIFMLAMAGQTVHPGLTRVSNIRFLLFKIKRVLVYNSTIFYFTDLFILYIFIQNAYAGKKVKKEKGLQIMFNRSNCQISGILTEPLNPRELE